MNTSLNGQNSLAQQTLTIRNTEAAGHILLSLYPDLERSPWNTAVLKPLGLQEPTPADITLTTGGVPAHAKVVWMGVIYVSSNLTAVIAYRA